MGGLVSTQCLHDTWIGPLVHTEIFPKEVTPQSVFIVVGGSLDVDLAFGSIIYVDPVLVDMNDWCEQMLWMNFMTMVLLIIAYVA